MKEPGPALRTFFAVFPPKAVLDALGALIQRARRPDDRISWVKRDNLHYTLRFLGELEPARAEAAVWAGRQAVRGMQPFDAVLGEPGAFPDFRRPRVLWIGMAAGGPELKLLAASLEEALRRAGFGRADRPFAAHLTLGRVREPGSPAGSQAAARLRDERAPGRFTVDALTVVRSQLHPQGSIYTPLAQCRFETTSPGTPPEENA